MTLSRRSRRTLLALSLVSVAFLRCQLLIVRQIVWNQSSTGNYYDDGIDGIDGIVGVPPSSVDVGIETEIQTETEMEIETKSKSSACILDNNCEDQRAVSPKGLLCIDGSKGRINNIILQTLTGMYFAMHINRTFAIPSEMSAIFDMERLNSLIATPEEYKYKPIVTWDEAEAEAEAEADQDYNTNSSSKKKMTCVKSNYTISRELDVLGRFERIDNSTKDLKLLSIHNNDIWYFLGKPSESFYAKFYHALAPKPIISSKANEFTTQVFGPDPKYNSVHLRHLEGHCHKLSESKELCCPSVNTVTQILKSRGADTSLPIFVANDGQCPDDILDGYKERNNTIMGYSGRCDDSIIGFEQQISVCGIIDFEIAVWAQHFVGNFASTGDMNIREWRVHRGMFSGSTSVLSLENSTIARENTTALTRNWYYQLKWAQDCHGLSANQRLRKPVCA